MNPCQKCGQTPALQTRHDADVAARKAGEVGHEVVREGDINIDKRTGDKTLVRQADVNAGDIRLACSGPGCTGSCTGWNKADQKAAVEAAWNEANPAKA